MVACQGTTGDACPVAIAPPAPCRAGFFAFGGSDEAQADAQEGRKGLLMPTFSLTAHAVAVGDAPQAWAVGDAPQVWAAGPIREALTRDWVPCSVRYWQHVVALRDEFSARQQ